MGFALAVDAAAPTLLVVGNKLINGDTELRRADRLWRKWARPLAPVRATWGMEDAESVEAYRAAERLAGGPAPLRPKESG